MSIRDRTIIKVTAQNNTLFFMLLNVFCYSLSLRSPFLCCLGKFYNPLANVKKMRQPAAGRELPQGIYARPSRRAPFATSRQTSMPMTVGTAKETAVHLRLWVSL